MELLANQLINGLAYAMLLFSMSAGLALIFGLMNVVNVSHGSFFMIGGYLAVSIASATGSFWVAMALAPVPAIATGILAERLLLRPLYRRGHLDQVLLTFGLTYIFVDAVRYLWGTEIHHLAVPEALSGVLSAGNVIVPVYRLFVIGFGLLLGLLMWLLLERSRLGAMVRASVDDAFTAAGLGIDVSRLFSIVFALGVGLAALGGVVAAPVMGVFPGMDTEILIPAFIVVVIGGLGSLKGAFVASLFVGVIDTFGKAYFPELAMFVIYLAMIAVLLLLPQGFYGRAAP